MEVTRIQDHRQHELLAVFERRKQVGTTVEHVPTNDAYMRHELQTHKNLYL